jgi:uncharacterized membrane protein
MMRKLPWRQTALLLSLALNLFLLAVIGTHMLRVRQFHRDIASQTPLQKGLIEAEAALSPADRKAFDKALLAGEASFGPAADRMAIARYNLANAVLAQPYNPAATAAAFDRWQMSWEQFQAAFRTPLLSALDAISPQGRRALVEIRRRHDSSP